MYNQIRGFKFFRNADGGATGGTPAGGADGAAATVGADGKAVTVGDAAAASASTNSATATAPTIVQKTDTTAPDFLTSLGEFKDDPALKDFKDPAALAKSYLETKKLVGQKLGIPGKDATPEAKAAFEKAMGVPDAPEGYGFKKPDGMPEGMEYDEADAAEWAKTFKENGIPAEKANALRNAFMQKAFTAFKGVSEKITGDKTKTDQQFDEVATKAFGDKKEAALQSARAIMEKHVPKEIREMMNGESNVALIAVATALSNYSKEMTGEDKVIGMDGSSTSGRTPQQMRDEARKLMALPEYSNPFVKGKEEHNRLIKQVSDLYANIAEAEKPRAKK